MASPAQSPMDPGAGSPPTPGPSGPIAAAADATHDAGGPTQALIKLAMDAKKISEDHAETAPMMREIQNQVRMATMKVIQSRQQTQQSAPQI